MEMFGLCCFAQSGGKEPPKTKPPNLLEEPAENLEAFREGLRSISTPATSFQKIGPDMIGAGKSSITLPLHMPQSQTSQKGKKGKTGSDDIIPALDIEVFERRQFEAYKEEVEKRRRLQLIERQMALFNTWEFYNEQEMWDLLVRYNQYIQSGHQIFLTPMPDCPIHGHSITSKQQQQSKRSHKAHKKLKQRRRQSASNLSDEQSSPYASQYSDNQRSDRSRSSLISRVSAEIHSTEKASMESVLKIMTTVDQPLPSDVSEKDSGIDKNSINSSIGNGSDRSLRKSLDHELHQRQPMQPQLQYKGSPASSHESVGRSPSPPVLSSPQAAENDYDLDVAAKPEQEDKHESSEYPNYPEGIYYARKDVEPDAAFGAIWENCSSTIINTYEDMDLQRRGSLGINVRKPRQRDESDEFAPPSEPRTEITYGNQELEEALVLATPTEDDIESNENALNSIEKCYTDNKSRGLDIDCRDLLECKGDQCSPSKVMLRSLNLSTHNLTEIPQSNEDSLERKDSYSKVNKEEMKVYELRADVRDIMTSSPPLHVKQIEALVQEDQDFYDDSRGQIESESLIKLIEPTVNNENGNFQADFLPQQQQQQQILPDSHQPIHRAATPSPPRTPRSHSLPRTVKQGSYSDEPMVVDEQPRRSQKKPALPMPSVTQEGTDVFVGDEGDKKIDESPKMFEMPKLRDASERKITPIDEENDELSIRMEIQKIITKLHKTGGWRKATSTPGEPYLTLDLRKESKIDFELPVVDFEVRAKELLVLVPDPQQASTVAEGEHAKEPERLPANCEHKRAYSQIDVEALDFKKAREALKKFTNDGSNPLLKQVPNRSIPMLVEETRKAAEASTTSIKAKLTKTVSAPPNLKTPQVSSHPPLANVSDPADSKVPQEPSEPFSEIAAADAHQESVRDEEEDRINFQAARETLQKLTSLNNGMFFMTDRKNRQAF